MFLVCSTPRFLFEWETEAPYREEDLLVLVNRVLLCSGEDIHIFSIFSATPHKSPVS